MSLEEVALQYKSDKADLNRGFLRLAKSFGTIVKRTYRFPLKATYNYITKSNNHYVFNLYAYKRGHWDRPLFCMFGIFDRPEGKYAFSVTDAGEVIFFPPHFFKRYRDRILKEDLHGEDLIKAFFSRNVHFYFSPLSAEFASKYREYISDDKESFAGSCTDGNLFLEKPSPYYAIVKTIVSDEMLGDTQTQAFSVLAENRDFLTRIRGVRQVSALL